LVTRVFRNANRLHALPCQDQDQVLVSMLTSCVTCLRLLAGICCGLLFDHKGLVPVTFSCSVCGYTSTAYDPFLDVSLDLFPILEAVKQHESQMTELRGCSRSNTAAAASGFGGGHASTLLSSQPSVSNPCSSAPSLSGTTDAFSTFSAVEGTTNAVGASRCR